MTTYRSDKAYHAGRNESLNAFTVRSTTDVARIAEQAQRYGGRILGITQVGLPAAWSEVCFNLMFGADEQALPRVAGYLRQEGFSEPVETGWEAERRRLFETTHR